MSYAVEVVDATCTNTSVCRHSQTGTYTMSGVCLNCGWKGEVTFSKGHAAKKVDCPRCGCFRTVATKDWQR